MEAHNTIYTTEGIRVRFEYDNQYDPFQWLEEGVEDSIRYCQEEADKISSGEWVVLSIIQEKKCCECGFYNQLESVWGCVVENNDEAIINMGIEHGYLPIHMLS